MRLGQAIKSVYFKRNRLRIIWNELRRGSDKRRRRAKQAGESKNITRKLFESICVHVTALIQSREWEKILPLALAGISSSSPADDRTSVAGIETDTESD